MKPVKKLTVSAILVALCLIFLYVGSVVRNLQISLIAACALLPAVAVIHCGYLWAAAVYAGAGILALLLLPDKSAAVWFLVVFGHYGILKSLIEQLKKPVFEWCLKVLLFGICVSVMFFLLHAFFAGILPKLSEWLLLSGLLICFVFYDMAFSALISFYYRRIKPHVK